MIKYLAIVSVFMLLSSLTVANAGLPASVSTDAIINLPIAGTWNLFTTVDGLNAAGYENVSMHLTLDGHVHAERKTGENMEIINATITSYDVQHMLSWRWSGNNACWSVLYFNAMGKEMTQIRWVDMCNDDQTPMLEQASQAHRDLFNKLIRRYAPECHVCKEEREAAEKADKY